MASPLFSTSQSCVCGVSSLHHLWMSATSAVCQPADGGVSWVTGREVSDVTSQLTSRVAVPRWGRLLGNRRDVDRLDANRWYPVGAAECRDECVEGGVTAFGLRPLVVEIADGCEVAAVSTVLFGRKWMLYHAERLLEPLSVVESLLRA